MKVYGLEAREGLPVLQLLMDDALEMEGAWYYEAAQEVYNRGRYAAIFGVDGDKVVMLAPYVSRQPVRVMDVEYPNP